VKAAMPQRILSFMKGRGLLKFALIETILTVFFASSCSFDGNGPLLVPLTSLRLSYSLHFFPLILFSLFHALYLVLR